MVILRYSTMSDVHQLDAERLDAENQLEDTYKTYIEEKELPPISPGKAIQETSGFIQTVIESISPLLPKTTEGTSLEANQDRVGSSILEIHRYKPNEFESWFKNHFTQPLDKANAELRNKATTPEENKQLKEINENIDATAHRIVQEAARQLNLPLTKLQLEQAEKTFKINYKLYQSKQDPKNLTFNSAEIAAMAKLSVLSTSTQFKKASEALTQARPQMDKENWPNLHIVRKPKHNPKKSTKPSEKKQPTLTDQQEEANLILFGATTSGKKRELGDLRYLCIVGNLFAAPDYNPAPGGSVLDLVSTPQFSQTDPLGKREAEIIRMLQSTSGMQPDLKQAFERMTGENEGVQPAAVQIEQQKEQPSHKHILAPHPK